MKKREGVWAEVAGPDSMLCCSLAFRAWHAWWSRSARAGEARRARAAARRYRSRSVPCVSLCSRRVCTHLETVASSVPETLHHCIVLCMEMPLSSAIPPLSAWHLLSPLAASPTHSVAVPLLCVMPLAYKILFSHKSASLASASASASACSFCLSYLERRGSDLPAATRPKCLFYLSSDVCREERREERLTTLSDSVQKLQRLILCAPHYLCVYSWKW